METSGGSVTSSTR